MDSPRTLPPACDCYDIVHRRDASFDGVLYVGVLTTGVYCRPVCRARPPRPENCRYFASAARAEAARFRPCLACRPELAPGLHGRAAPAPRTLAGHVATLLDAYVGTNVRRPVDVVAAAMGVTTAQLRRQFATQHGVTPAQYLLTRRLLLAKQLLTDTDVPVAEVALASGLAGAPRLTRCFLTRYAMHPSRLRARPSLMPPGAQTPWRVRLAYRPPYDVTSQLRFLDRRAVTGVEWVQGRHVRRSVPAGLWGPSAGWIEVTLSPTAARVELRYASSLGPQSAQVIAAVRRWLDLDAAPDVIDAALTDLPGSPGLRLPGCLDPFELVVRAILGQQVSVAAARTLAGRLVQRFGEPARTPWPQVTHHFPSAQRLAQASPGQVDTLGILPSRARTIVDLAQAWAPIQACLALPDPVQPLIERLLGVCGIGRWTAHYVAMRTLGWTDAFLHDDVAVLKAMRQLFRIEPRREVLARAASWQPWRSYAVLRLWNSLEGSSA